MTDRDKVTKKKVITEEMHLEKEWFREARTQTLKTLPKFIDHVLNDYEHDYGTAVHAVSACAIAAAWAANDAERLTGFQASFVMWDFIRQWSYESNKTELRLINFDNMLYLQDEEKFDKIISKGVWKSLQEADKKNLEDIPGAHPDVIAHWEKIVAGIVPFGYTIKED